MPLPFLAAAGLLSSGIGAIFKGIQARKQQRMADAIHPVNAVYNSSPYAKNQLDTVRQMMNGRMAGAAQEQNNIYGNFANSMAGVERNSTSGAQSLAMLAGLQGNADNAFSQLQQKEAMNGQNMLGYLSSANQDMTQEAQKVYNDKIRNYYDDLNAKNALQSAAWQNKGAMWDGIQNSVIGAGSMAQSGAFNGLFGGGGNVPQMAQTDLQVPNYVQSGQLNGGSYINPFVSQANPQQINYTNPFLKR